MNTSIIIPHVEEFEIKGGLSTRTYILSGAFAGLFEHSMMFPVDTIKTRMQALRQPTYLGISNAFKSIIKNEGVLGIYSGLSAVLLGAIPSHALSFFSYEFMKKKLSLEEEDHHRPSHFTAGAAGASATIVHDFISTPLDVLKQRMQVYNSPFKNLFSCIRTTYKEGGMKIFFVSYPVTVMMNIPYAIVHFITYEMMKTILHEVEEEEKSWNHLVSGGVAGAIGGFVSNPFDVIKTRLQTQKAEDNYKGLADVVKRVYKENGWKSFMKGVNARMLYFAPSAALTWASYEYAKVLFHID